MVTLQPETLNQMYAHAKSDFPDECCGVILHVDAQEFVRPCRNVQNQLHREDPVAYPRDARTAYLIHPDDLMAVHKEAETQHRPIKAFYHSHPNHEAYFSEKDKSDAMAWGEPIYPDVAYLVISIYREARKPKLAMKKHDTEIRVVKAYAWDETTTDFIEVPMQIANRDRGETCSQE